MQHTIIPRSQSFNAHHSPVGAFASFTLGQFGPAGGFGLELGKPADQHLYIGAETSDSERAFEAFPFFGEANHLQEQFVLESQGDVLEQATFSSIPVEKIERRFGTCSDTWKSGGLEFSIYSPVWPIPDPESADPEELKKVLIPAVFAELTLDNRQGSKDRRCFFGYQPENDVDHIRENWNMGELGITGLCNGNNYGVATLHEDSQTSLHFNIESILGEPDRDRFHFGNATTGVVDWVVPAGEKRTVQLVLGFHKRGIVTSGLECSYFYSRFYDSLESVLAYGLKHFERYKTAALEMDGEWFDENLSEDQQFQLSHSIRSYYGSSQLLDHLGDPLWVINEGEYRMMNTLDLTADQLFFELRQNPWTTRNVLDQFVDRYSYRDEVFFPETPEKHYAGGLSFSHDMGVMNCFSKPGTSSYEISGLKGCFSYMTHEELINWSCCAAAYGHVSEDHDWMNRMMPVFEACFQSICNRDHPDPQQRDGVMKLDSCKTNGGGEITTYDSLDVSLGQSRGNTYLAVKTWATYLAFEKVFEDRSREELAKNCRIQAKRTMRTLLASVGDDGTIPAVLGSDHPSVIIPIIEGLVFPRFSGREDVLSQNSEFAPLIEALKTHLKAVLKKGVCLFEDGGWKLSSTSINSWLSKIYLCQYIARDILGMDGDFITESADKAHVAWLLDPANAYWAWGDQVYAGELKGSKYYPRGVTSCLWVS